MRYLVTYDLRGNESPSEYDRIATALKNLGAKRVLLSTWVLRHANTNSETLRNHLQQFMDKDDRLLVVQFGDWASYGAMVDINTI